MYRNYEIRSIDTTEKMVVFKFVLENTRDYITRRYYEGNITEEKIVNMAKDAQVEAVVFYQRDNTAPAFTPASWTGTLNEVVVAAYPDYDPVTESLTETWEETETTRTQTFSVSTLSDEDIAQNVRNKRDELLFLTDNNALSDRTLSSTFTTYRQALRDVTSQDGFPTSITWPVKPTE